MPIIRESRSDVRLPRPSTKHRPGVSPERPGQPERSAVHTPRPERTVQQLRDDAKHNMEKLVRDAIQRSSVEVYVRLACVAAVSEATLRQAAADKATRAEAVKQQDDGGYG